MTTPNWRLSANRSAGTARIADISRYVKAGVVGSEAPIDIFYRSTGDMLRAADPNLLAQHPALGALILVGFVSSVENYFRDLFARIVAICPVAQDAAGQQTVSFGTVIWHGGQIPERGAFEHLSFTSAENVKTTAKKFLAFEIRKNGAFDSALLEFERICELRHGVVHSGGVLAGKNALRLQLLRTNPGCVISVGFSEVQECGDVCATLVAAANSELFTEMVQRWAVQWRRHGTWEPTHANKRFRGIWSIFYSKTDEQNHQIPVALSLVRCRNLVRREFRL